MGTTYLVDRKAAAAVLGWLGSMKLAWADALDDSSLRRARKGSKAAASREAAEAGKAATLATSGEGAATTSSVAAV